MLRAARSLTALTVILLAILLPPSARAATVSVLTTGSVGGPNVPVGDLISLNLKAGTQARWVTMPGGGTGVFCSAWNFSGSVSSNPPAGGIATAGIPTMFIGGCSSNIPGLTLQLIGLSLPYTVTFNGSTKVVTITGSGGVQLTFRFGSGIGPVLCTYRPVGGAISGPMSNFDSSVTFTNQQFARGTGLSPCPADLYFSAIYIVTATGGRVFIQ